MVIHPHSTALKGKVHIQCQHTITVTPQLFWRTSSRCSSITKRERQADRHSYINTDRDKRERIKMEKGWESDKELKTKQTCGLLWKVVWDKAAHCFRTCFWFALKFCPKWYSRIKVFRGWKYLMKNYVSVCWWHTFLFGWLKRIILFICTCFTTVCINVWLEDEP